MNTTWKLVSLGDRKHRLETAAGRVLGWIRGHAVGLFGLRDESDALTWAPSLRRALDDALAREYPERYQPVRDFSNLRLVHDGAYEWIAAGDVPLARVHRPSSERGDDRFALEFVLPSYASEAVTITAATMLATMLYERILSPSFTCDTEESTHAETAEPAQRPAGAATRRRRECVTRQLPRERPTEVERSSGRAAHAFRGVREGRGRKKHS